MMEPSAFLVVITAGWLSVALFLSGGQWTRENGLGMRFFITLAASFMALAWVIIAFVHGSESDFVPAILISLVVWYWSLEPWFARLRQSH